MNRLINAYRNSARAFRRLMKSEAAFQQEIVLLILALPAGWFIATTWRDYLLLIGVILLLLLVEVLNTAIEAACDAVSVEFRPEIQLSKDCGSFAVLITIVIAAAVWLTAVAERALGLL